MARELVEFSSDTGRPPFATSIYIFPSARVPLSLEDAEKASKDIANTLSGEVGLPLRLLVTEVSSGGSLCCKRLTKPANTWATQELVYMDGISEHMDIVKGEPLQ